ncbi:hypothetical protein OPT61_g7170 [Boeremia exigua]|uniref:Uncharacterized protein n=1 Tax=Boeremia exigua TaxID=749465 RepID=A0ACC2I3S2_9PLEO|nr:hypothetical protein OPT61_g7170 [Boeremia exigua]
MQATIKDAPGFASMPVSMHKFMVLTWSAMSYSVYLVSSIGAPRNHHAIFFETERYISGYIFQVTGNIQSGMTFGHRKTTNSEDLASFIDRTFLGTIAESDFARIQPVVETIPPPPKQFNGPKRIDPSRPLRRCQEWTKDAVEALRAHDILRT